MTHKVAFFLLDHTARQRIRVLVGAVAALNVVEFAASSRFGGGGTSIGIIGNLLVLSCCAFPSRAPSEFFKLLPYLWWISAVFDGLELYRGLARMASAGWMLFLSVAKRLVLPFLAAPLLRLRRHCSTRRPRR